MSIHVESYTVWPFDANSLTHRSETSFYLLVQQWVPDVSSVCLRFWYLLTAISESGRWWRFMRKFVKAPLCLWWFPLNSIIRVLLGWCSLCSVQTTITTTASVCFPGGLEAWTSISFSYKCLEACRLSKYHARSAVFFEVQLKILEFHVIAVISSGPRGLQRVLVLCSCMVNIRRVVTQNMLITHLYGSWDVAFSS